MIKEIRLPEISENVESGEVIKVLVSEGDTVEVDQPLVELETEKAVFEVPSTAAGRVTEVLVGEGDTVKVGQTLVKIETDGEADDEEKTEKKTGKEAGKTDEEEDQEESGKEGEERDEEQDEKKKKETDEEERDEEDADKEPETASKPEPESGKSGPPPAAPSVRRLARELGVDIHRVKGTGKGGKISADDVKLYAKGVITAASSGAPAQGATGIQAKPLPDFSKFGDIERKPMSKVRRLTAENLSASWATVPQVTQHDKADITDVEAARKRYADRAKKAGGKLTMTAILLKACAGALKQFPDFNASVDMAAGEIVYKKYVNIGVAVDTERGLLVPVIKDVDCKSIIDLSVDLTDISEKARNKKIKPDQLEGGNFTISNLGGIGGTYFSPIVYSPEVAILGVSRAEMRPKRMGGKFSPRLMLPLSLSYDHRLIDGAQAARFTRWLAEALEDPVLLAMEG
ncbi:MAG: 2-oxo acid dehydrogenase subunit E2 [Candidatus Latescibacterota bacterium]|jgi:pyruvate dehydrogenase E2 component (dihydrolipoamide acetyltransferase)